jgi:hypothetical protein
MAFTAYSGFVFPRMRGEAKKTGDECKSEIIQLASDIIGLKARSGTPWRTSAQGVIYR